MSQQEKSTGFSKRNIAEQNMWEDLQGKIQDRKQRKVFSYWIYGFVAIYIIAIVVFVYLIGFGCVKCSNTVVVTLLSTNTANVISIFAIVVRYLYNIKK
jgi:hypothetical protein